MFAKTFGCVRFIYNRMLADKIAYYEETGKTLYNSPAQYNKEFEWLKEVDSLALSNAKLYLYNSYKNFFSNPKFGFPKFKSKKSNKNSYTTNRIGNNIYIKDGYIKLPKISPVKIKQHRQIPENYKLKSVTVSQNPSGKYFVSILFEYENQVQEIKPKTFLGLDFSMHELYVDSNGDKPEYPRYYRKAEKKLKREQRKLSLMCKGSNNYNKQRVKVAKLYEKTTNQRKDFLHKQSRILAKNYDCVCIENLNLQEMSQKLNLGKSVADNSWGMFVSFLNYKLTDLGKHLIKVDKYFPSSQLCSNCGYKNTETKDLSVREWTCPSCGTFHNRDINAAINIKNEGMRIIAA